jgi:poly-gamma-glutamate synthesis protein (capsule biosynthesis protein)
MSRPAGVIILVWLAASAVALSGCGGSAGGPSPEPGPPLIPDLPPPLSGSVHVAAVGDVLLDRGVQEAIAANGMDSILAVVADQLRRVDITFGNLENPLATTGARDPARSVFRGDPANVQVLVLGGFEIVSLANNHTLNSGPEALVETIDCLETAGIRYVGAAREEAHGSDPVFLDVRGLQVGFLAYTDLDFAHGSYSRVDADLTQLRQQIAAAKTACDVLLVSYHWGNMDQRRPTSRQVEVAHASIDAGADAVLGHHPHVLQGLEVYRGRPILYSLGNFVFDQSSRSRREGGLFELVYSAAGGWQVWMTPVAISMERMGPEYPTPQQRSAILNGLQQWSGELGASVDVVRGWAYVDCAGG